MRKKLVYAWQDRKYLIGKYLERALMWLVWRLPRKVIMWSSIRMMAHATTGKYENTVPDELSIMDALERWN